MNNETLKEGNMRNLGTFHNDCNYLAIDSCNKCGWINKKPSSELGDVESMADNYSRKHNGIREATLRQESYKAFKAGHASRQQEVDSIKESLICPSCGVEGYVKDIKVCSDAIRIDLDKKDSDIRLLEKELSEAKARIDELEKFFCEIAKSMSGIRIAVDYMATRNRTNSQIHPTNIDYFKKLDEKLFDLDNKIFEFGNFENGEFVFKSAMESEKK